MYGGPGVYNDGNILLRSGRMHRFCMILCVSDATLLLCDAWPCCGCDASRTVMFVPLPVTFKAAFHV